MTYCHKKDFPVGVRPHIASRRIPGHLTEMNDVNDFSQMLFKIPVSGPNSFNGEQKQNVDN